MFVIGPRFFHGLDVITSGSATPVKLFVQYVPVDLRAHVVYKGFEKIN